MVVGPSVAHAGKKAPAAKTALSQLALTGTVGATTDQTVTVDLQAVNAGPDGLMVELDAVSVSVRFGDQEAPVALFWMNDEYPLSRRMLVPRFVDIPAGPPLLAGRFHIELEDSWKGKTDGVLKIVVRVATETGESTEVVLDAIPLARTSGENV